MNILRWFLVMCVLGSVHGCGEKKNPEKKIVESPVAMSIGGGAADAKTALTSFVKALAKNDLESARKLMASDEACDALVQVVSKADSLADEKTMCKEYNAEMARQLGALAKTIGAYRIENLKKLAGTGHLTQWTFSPKAAHKVAEKLMTLESGGRHFVLFPTTVDLETPIHSIPKNDGDPQQIDHRKTDPKSIEKKSDEAKTPENDERKGDDEEDTVIHS